MDAPNVARKPPNISRDFTGFPLLRASARDFPDLGRLWMGQVPDTSTWSLRKDPLKMVGHDQMILGNDPIFKGSWRL